MHHIYNIITINTSTVLAIHAGCEDQTSAVLRGDYRACVHACVRVCVFAGTALADWVVVHLTGYSDYLTSFHEPPLQPY